MITSSEEDKVQVENSVDIEVPEAENGSKEQMNAYNTVPCQNTDTAIRRVAVPRQCWQPLAERSKNYKKSRE